MNFVVATLSWFDSMSLTEVQVLFDILQSLTIIIATTFTAWWAYSTFGHKEKTDELLAIARKIAEIHSHIEGSVSLINLHTTLESLGASDSKRLENLKREAKVRLDILADELDQTLLVSFRVPLRLRLLQLGTYKLDMWKLGDPEHWGDKEVAKKLLEKKILALYDIEREINAHRRGPQWVGRKFKNGIFHLKNLVGRKEST